MKILKAFFFLLCAVFVWSLRCRASLVVTDVLKSLPVAAGNVGDFQTSIAYHKGAVYTINVEPADGKFNGVNLRTVVRKGIKIGQDYRWVASLVESRTIDDPWHTLGSIGIDKAGYIHVAYNMHNMPWQYSVSRRPEDVSEFDFFGDRVDLMDIKEVKFNNRSPFFSLGKAALPGTQVTYPAFFNDRYGELYITYRFALKPKLPWIDRVYSGGLAKYDVKSKKWIPIGGVVDLSSEEADVHAATGSRVVTAFCSAKGWWANQVRLWFDKWNRMYLAWSWADYGRFQLGLEPEPRFAFAYSSDGMRFLKGDGQKYELPISYDESDFITENKGYRGVANVTIADEGKPIVMAIPANKSYHYVVRSRDGSGWDKPLASPSAASVLLAEDGGKIWAFATGPTVYATRTPRVEKSWQIEYQESGGWGYPKVVYLRKERAFLVHLTKCLDWKPAKDQSSETQGDCFVRIVRVDM